jgi:dTDP-4-dehydrorhamnose reductase
MAGIDRSLSSASDAALIRPGGGMRLIVSGWHGQLARALADEALSAPDVTACAIGRPALDVRDPRSIERAFADVSPDLAINTAAYTAVDDAEAELERAFKLNRDGARQFAIAAARRRIPVIHVSTHYVFDGTKSAPHVETDEPKPASAYGRSKLEGENAIREINLQHVVLRTGWVFSASGRNFFTRVRRLATEGDGTLRMVADQRGNPTYAPHLAKAILGVVRRVLADDGASPVWGTYHVAGSGIATWYDFAKEIAKGLERGGWPSRRIEMISSADYASRSMRPANCTLDCSLFERTFGVRLPDWQEGVRACLDESEARRS